MGFFTAFFILQPSLIMFTKGANIFVYDSI